MVRRTLSLANHPALIESELAQRALDWYDAFDGIIPAERVPDAFKQALKNHKGSFPVNAFEIVDAWRTIETEESWQLEIERNRRMREERDQGQEASALTHYCRSGDHEFGRGTVFLPGYKGQKFEAPCPACRPSEYEKATADLASETARLKQLDWEAEKPARIAQIEAIQAKLRNHSYEPKCDLVGERIRALGFEVQDAGSNEEYEQLHEAWLKLLRIAKYVRENDLSSPAG